MIIIFYKAFETKCAISEVWIKYVYEKRNYKKGHSEESDPKQKNQVRGGKLVLLIDYHSQYMMFLLIRFIHESSTDNN